MLHSIYAIATRRLAQLSCLLALIIPSHLAFAHGTVTYPPSRIWNCYQENPENPESAPCIDAVASHGTQPLYDWNEINQANAAGNHQEYVMDGNLASGGRPEKYGGMDQVRNDWVATSVSAGPLTVSWTNTAPHATAYYDVYITKEEWTPDQPLTWASLVLLVSTEESAPQGEVDIQVVLPERTGKHVLYSVWQRADSPEAFYSTSDIDFGEGSPTSTAGFNEAGKDFTAIRSYPNPCSGESTIEYRLQNSQPVSLKIYDVHGREVASLVDGFQASGARSIRFDASTLDGGIYFYVLSNGTQTEVKRVVVAH